MSGYLAYCTALQTCLKQCNTLWQSVLYTANITLHFSLRLGLELLGEENCIEFHPILLDCKRRNPKNLAGSVPNVPTSANILIQKKEQKSLLLEFVIDFAFARFSLRRLGNNKAGGIDAAAALYCVFPARNLGYKSNDKAATRHILLFLCIVSCKPDNAQNNKSHSIWSGFIIAFASLVIPAVPKPQYLI